MILIGIYFFCLFILNKSLIRKKSRYKILSIVAILTLILISSFRYFNWGPPDILSYQLKYNYIKKISLNYYLKNLFNNSIKDPFFYILMKIINNIGFNFRNYLVIIYGISFYGLGVLIYKNSKNILLSLLCFISLGKYYFMLSGLRQGIAIGIVLLSYEALKKNKKYSFVLIVLLASLFHKTALIFLIAYPLSKIELSNKKILILSLLAPVLSLNKIFIIKILRYLPIKGRFVSYILNLNGLNIVGLLIQLFILWFCLFYRNSLRKKLQDNFILYNLLCIGVLLQSGATVIGEFFRLSLYFSIFSIILIPNVIFSIHNKTDKKILNFLIALILIIYILYDGSFFGFTLNL